MIQIETGENHHLGVGTDATVMKQRSCAGRAAIESQKGQSKPEARAKGAGRTHSGLTERGSHVVMRGADRQSAKSQEATAHQSKYPSISPRGEGAQVRLRGSSRSAPKGQPVLLFLCFSSLFTAPPLLIQPIFLSTHET